MNPSDEWITPWEYYWKWDSKYHFTVDVAADNYNRKCKRFYTVEDNGLLQNWTDEVVFCNPPYSNIYPWTEKASKLEARVTFMVLPSNTDNKWFHNFIWNKDTALWYPHIEGNFLQGRIPFDNPYKKVSGPRYATLIAVFIR